jgi:hypothetical protein
MIPVGRIEVGIYNVPYIIHISIKTTSTHNSSKTPSHAPRSNTITHISSYQITMTPQQNSPLLNLPGELRNLIYGFVLAEPKTVSSKGSVTNELRLINRQIHEETKLLELNITFVSETDDKHCRAIQELFVFAKNTTSLAPL